MRIVLSMSPSFPADRVKVEDGSWNVTLSRPGTPAGEVTVDKARAERLLRLEKAGRKVLQVVRELDP